MKNFIILFLLSTNLLVSAGPTISQHSVEKLVKYWQTILLLSDYEFRVSIVPLDHLPKGTAGASACDELLKRCQIKVLQPKDYALLPSLHLQGKAILEDIEDTIVHELVHIRLQPVTNLIPTSDAIDPDLKDGTEEMVVVRLTKALLQEKYHRHY